MSSHHMEVCQYGTRHSGCRCMGPHTERRIECNTPEDCQRLQAKNKKAKNKKAKNKPSRIKKLETRLNEMQVEIDRLKSGIADG